MFFLTHRNITCPTHDLTKVLAGLYEARLLRNPNGYAVVAHIVGDASYSTGEPQYIVEFPSPGCEGWLKSEVERCKQAIAAILEGGRTTEAIRNRPYMARAGESLEISEGAVETLRLDDLIVAVGGASAEGRIEVAEHIMLMLTKSAQRTYTDLVQVPPVLPSIKGLKHYAQKAFSEEFKEAFIAIDEVIRVTIGRQRGEVPAVLSYRSIGYCPETGSFIFEWVRGSGHGGSTLFTCYSGYYDAGEGKAWVVMAEKNID